MLDKIFQDFTNDLDYYINLIILDKLPLKNRLSSVDLPINKIEHSQWRQIIYNTASGIIRSQIKKATSKRYKRYKQIYYKAVKTEKRKSFLSKRFSQLKLKPIYKTKFFTKPNLKRVTIILDQRIVDFKNGIHFDEFIRIKSPYFQNGKRRAITIKLPINHHKHSLKYKEWERKKSIELRKKNGNYFIDLIYEKEEQDKKVVGDILEIDQGYKKLLTCSDGQIHGTQLFEIYNRISNKKQGSKAFKRLLIHRNNEINRSCNQLDLYNIKEMVVENLKNVKYKSNFNHVIMNKIQRWSYPLTMAKLERFCEENGVLFTKVNPAYTSQSCSKCGYVDSKNRSGELFTCQHCGVKMDADLNASINISRMGVCNPHSSKINYPDI